MIIKGKIWKFKDNIDTDQIIPARYLNTSDPLELASHVMEDSEKPNFAKEHQEGDIIVAGKNFGSGSSREHAPIAIKYAGVPVVVAKSFARIFFRNAINIGLPIVECKEAVDEAEDGDIFEIDLENGTVKNVTKGKSYSSTKFPEELMAILKAGGLMEYAKSRLSS